MNIYSLFILSWLLLSGQAVAAEEKIIYGYVEKVTLVEKNLMLSAKLDTGAKSASLSAVDIKEVQLKGKPYLQFTVPSKQGNVQFIAQYIGKVRIKLRAGEIPEEKLRSVKRPIVLMRIKMGNKVRDISVNLTNRKRFIYPLLLGRDAIKAFSGLVDPSIVFTIKSDRL